MAYINRGDKGGMRIPRRKTEGIGDILPQCIRMLGLSSGLNTHLIFKAWDDVSGAGPFTLRRYFRSGTLYITVNSSVIRNQLYFQKDALVEKMNKYIADEGLFDRNNASVGQVKNLILK